MYTTIYVTTRPEGFELLIKSCYMFIHGLDISCAFRSHNGLPAQGLYVMHKGLLIMCEWSVCHVT